VTKARAIRLAAGSVLLLAGLACLPARACTICDFCSADPAYIQADQRLTSLLAQAVLAHTRTRDACAAVGCDIVASAAPAEVDLAAVETLSAQLLAGNALDKRLGAYCAALEMALRQVHISGATPATQLAAARLSSYVDSLCRWLEKHPQAKEARLRAEFLRLLATWPRDEPRARERALNAYAAVAASMGVPEQAASLLLDEAQRKECPREVAETLAVYVTRELGEGNAVPRAEMFLATLRKRQGRLFEAREGWRRIVANYPWSNWGPAAAISLGAQETVLGRIEGLAVLEGIIRVYEAGPPEGTEMTPTMSARAKDTAAWAQHRIGYTLQRAGRHDEAKKAFGRLVQEYPDTVYTKRAQAALGSTAKEGVAQ